MVLPSQEIVSTHVCYSNKGICALLTQLSGRYIEKTMCTLPRDCTYSAAKLPSWSESILIILSVYTGDPVVDSREDSQNDSGELLEVQLMDYRSLKEKKKLTGSRHLSFYFPFMSCIFALVGCTESNEGSPSGTGAFQGQGCLRVISQ